VSLACLLPAPWEALLLQVGTRYCLVHVDTSADTCRQWNRDRPEEAAYSEEIFEDLACRWVVVCVEQQVGRGVQYCC